MRVARIDFQAIESIGGFICRVCGNWPVAPVSEDEQDAGAPGFAQPTDFVV